MLADDIIGKLHILPVEKLKSHEETIPFNVQRLKEATLNLGRLVDPLIVDDRHNIVIDGNHRLSVLRSIKCPNAVCQMVDYSDPGIKLGSWYPVSKTVLPEEIDGFTPKKVEFGQGMEAINSMKATFMYVKLVGGKKECWLYDCEEHTLSGLISHQRKFLSKLEGRDIIYTKDEIVAEANAGRQMPPKSTRHMIPGRIIRLNMHLGWLAEPPEIAREMMVASLQKRLTDGSIRRYTEEVIVLY